MHACLGHPAIADALPHPFRTGPSLVDFGIAATVSIGDHPFHDRYRWRNTSGRTSRIAADFRDARVDR